MTDVDWRNIHYAAVWRTGSGGRDVTFVVFVRVKSDDCGLGQGSCPNKVRELVHHKPACTA